MSPNHKEWQKVKKLLNKAQQKSFKLKFGPTLDKAEAAFKSAKAEAGKTIKFTIAGKKNVVEFPDPIKLGAKIQPALPVFNKAVDILDKYEKILKGFPSTTGSMKLILSTLQGIDKDLKVKAAWLAKKMPTKDEMKKFKVAYMKGVLKTI